MTPIRMFLCAISLVLPACATAPYPAESGINLKDAILLASRDLTQAGRTIEANPKEFKTFGLRPSKATVSFDIQAIHGNQGKAEISVAPVQVPVGGVFGWSASRQIQKGNHIEIEFAPPK